jgi:hypothetical protein
MNMHPLAARSSLYAGVVLALMTVPAQAAFMSTAGVGFTPVLFDGSGPIT